MKDLLSKRISTFEHIFHIFLSLASGGYWLIIYIIRALAYKQSNQNGESKLKSSSAVIRKSDKASNLKIGDYSKRVFATEEEADEDEWSEYAEEYSFDVVGESYNREKILAIIRENNAIKQGELLVEAIMVKEPDNEFDDNAVLVAVNKKKVGYVPSDISYEIANYLDERGLDGIRVKGKFGWDTTNPSPAIGLKLDFNF
jgi:hypothetical protein